MAAQHDMKSARTTYEGFLGVFKWGAIACALIAAFVVYLIA
jgi:hypothetical protein